MSVLPLERLESTPLPRTFATLLPLSLPVGPLLPTLIRGTQGGSDGLWAIAAILLTGFYLRAMWRSMGRPPYELLIDDEKIVHRTPGKERWWNRPIFGSTDASRWTLRWDEIEGVETVASEIDGARVRVLALSATATKRMIVLESRTVSAIAEPERLLAHLRRRGFDV